MGDDAPTFHIDFKKSRGKVGADVYFSDKHGNREDLLDGSGGGVLDLTAFALRVAAVVIRRPPRRRFLVLDECFKHLSQKKNYRDRVRGLLEALAEDLDMQFLIITHDPRLQIGKVIEL